MTGVAYPCQGFARFFDKKVQMLTPYPPLTSGGLPSQRPSKSHHTQTPATDGTVAGGDR